MGVAFVLTSCASLGPVGLIYSGATGMSSATRVITTTTGSKTGTSTACSICGLFAFGDSGIAAAAKDGGITKIESVDTKTTNVLGVYTAVTTIVTGE